MNTSIYHFFADLLQRRGYFAQFENLENFEFPRELVAVRSKGTFPDLVLKKDGEADLPGGEFIELKTAQSYVIPSFNSTLPTAKKPMNALAKKVRNILIDNGEIFELDEVRDVYYLLVGRNKRARPAPRTKVCLVHGSFFETIPTKDALIKAAVEAIDFSSETVEIEKLFEQDSAEEIQNRFASSRSITGSSINLRFRVMAEAHGKANLMKESEFSQIGDDTISMIIPHQEMMGQYSENLYD